MNPLRWVLRQLTHASTSPLVVREVGSFDDTSRLYLVYYDPHTTPEKIGPQHNLPRRLDPHPNPPTVRKGHTLRMSELRASQPKDGTIVLWFVYQWLPDEATAPLLRNPND